MNKDHLNIAIAVPRLEIGGLEAVLKTLAGYLTSVGHNVTFVETQSKGSWSDEFRALDLSVVTLAASKLISPASHALRVGRELGRYDVVIVNDAPYAQSALGLMRQDAVAIPVLHLPIQSLRFNAKGNPGEWEFIVAVSPGMRDAIIGMDGVPPERVICIPNGVEVASEWPKQNNDFTNKTPLRVIYVGRIEDQQKGVMHLPGIVRRLRDNNVNFEITIIGDGPDLISLKREFAAGCADCQVSFSGAMQHKEVLGQFAIHDVILMPSYFEGLPIALLEAMAEGVVPVVSRLCGQTDFIVANGENGFLVDAGDEDGFAAAIVSVAGNRDDLRKLSYNGWNTIKDRFSAEEMGRAYEVVIEQCMVKRSTGVDTVRSKRIDLTLLGDLPWLPGFMIRPVRKALRMIGLWQKPAESQKSMREWAAGKTAKSVNAICMARSPNINLYEGLTEVLQEISQLCGSLVVLAGRSKRVWPSDTAIEISLKPAWLPGFVNVPAKLLLSIGSLGECIQNSPGLFIGGDTWGNELAAVLAWLFRRPYVHYSLELPGTRQGSHKLSDQLARWSYRRADLVITMDESHADFIARETGVLRERILLMPNSRKGPGRRHRTRVFRDQFRLSDADVLILHAGGIGAAQGSKELACAASRWKKGRYLVFHAHCPMAHEPYYQEFKIAINGYKNVCFNEEPVSSEKVDNIAGGADIGIAWYDRELLGYRADLLGLAAGKIGRYLRNGMPVIVRNLPTIRTYIDKYRCGICIDSLEESGSAIETIMADYETFAGNSLRCYEELWRSDRHLTGLRKRIEELISVVR